LTVAGVSPGAMRSRADAWPSTSTRTATSPGAGPPLPFHLVMLDPLHKALLEAIERAWETGCPVAGPAAREQLASIAVRRWRSFGRRTRKRRPSDSDRIEDLAKGLRDALEADRSLVGPLMEDYRHLARVLAQMLRDLTDE
jgi:hypothetical protein